MVQSNYHYLVPECDNADIIALTGDKIFKEYLEAKELDIESKPILIGIFTLFKLIAFKDEKTQKLAKEKLLNAYIELFDKLNELKVTWLELDEPYLVYDLNKEDIALFEEFYQELLNHKKILKFYFKAILET